LKKKKQKTFIPLDPYYVDIRAPVLTPENGKSFLVLFFQKKNCFLPFRCPKTKPMLHLR
jgi:hypothetical protein